ncbi:uncharacterized protein TM35_000511350 [Trypanosoma theileri]|uniref:Mucin TcMUCII n=1 Tax=Trypanosoma theileri TaxID=67003 RepID=A0A1X0NGY0_9TRYP|nr:uncharacterized protein TM35_000511350 [Trypanosoma theileri]ORC84034.1 hypothetical protein TM35_000511350 [Trypanosoma theileri]
MIMMRYVLCVMLLALCCFCSVVDAGETEGPSVSSDQVLLVQRPAAKPVPRAGEDPETSQESVREDDTQCEATAGVGGEKKRCEPPAKAEQLPVEDQEAHERETGNRNDVENHTNQKGSGPSISVELRPVITENSHENGAANSLQDPSTAILQRDSPPSLSGSTAGSPQGGSVTGDDRLHVASGDNGRAQGGGDQPKVEKTTEEKANTPGSEQADENEKNEKESKSDSSTVSSTVNTDTQEHRSQQEQTPSSQESQSHNDTTENDNSTSTNSETSTTASEEESTTTATTTTTTTLPPETANNKKGDADSSSSISSSVWVRVPLLIVVTLACILVC